MGQNIARIWFSLQGWWYLCCDHVLKCFFRILYFQKLPDKSDEGSVSTTNEEEDDQVAVVAPTTRRGRGRKTSRKDDREVEDVATTRRRRRRNTDKKDTSEDEEEEDQVADVAHTRRRRRHNTGNKDDREDVMAAVSTAPVPRQKGLHDALIVWMQANIPDVEPTSWHDFELELMQLVRRYKVQNVSILLLFNLWIYWLIFWSIYLS